MNDVDAGCAGSAKKEEELPPLTDAIWNLVNRKINLHHEGMLFGTEMRHKKKENAFQSQTRTVERERKEGCSCDVNSPLAERFNNEIEMEYV